MVYRYNKLVRDKVIQNINKAGKNCTYEILNEVDYEKELNKKLKEEVIEYMADKSEEELADILEVITAIMAQKKITWEEIQSKMLEKRNKNGGFQNRVYLKEVIEKSANQKEEENIAQKQKALWEFLNETESLTEIQEYIKEITQIRGSENQKVEHSMLLLTEEVGELAKAVRKNATNIAVDMNQLSHYDTVEDEVADVFYVLINICNTLNVNLFQALKQKEEKNIKRTWKKE